jgi:hypothetical protein
MTDVPWPTPLKPCAYHGVLGEIVQAIAPQTEADPVAVLVHLLVMFGNCIGRTPLYTVGADEHHLNLFAAIVGTTAKGRKGMSRGQAQRVFADIDEEWIKRITSGLSSGEGLIWAVRDPITRERAVFEKGRVKEYETLREDSGVEDKRLCVIETEFSSTLKVMGRDGNTLSSVIRQAWDGYDLSTLTKASTARATAPHISILAHITAPELRRYLEATEAANGFGNRFLWFLAKRSKELPHGGQAVSLDRFSETLRDAIAGARRSKALKRDGPANQLWEQIYGWLSDGRPGMLGAMTARAEAQVMRLAGLYALADTTHVIGVVHLQAALELWRYSFRSARVLFGDRVGDPVADAILSHLRRLYPESVTRTEISTDVFHRNKQASQIDRALALLLEHKLASFEKDRDSAGRPVERWYSSDELNEFNEVTHTWTEDSSFNSSNSSPKEPREEPDS